MTGNNVLYVIKLIINLLHQLLKNAGVIERVEDDTC
jgi:hypothetical protein